MIIFGPKNLIFLWIFGKIHLGSGITYYVNILVLCHINFLECEIFTGNDHFRLDIWLVPFV